MIKVSHLTKSFADQKVLDDISLEVHTGEILAVLGPSGTGKSVFLQHLIGLMKPDRGNIFIDSTDITRLREKDLLKLRKNIGYLFQQAALYDFWNVFENIAFPLREHTKLDSQAITSKVKKILQLLDLEGVEEKFPAQLSGGMKKRVGLGRALILDSKILFCDEPTSGLDPILSRDISDLIKKVSKDFQCTTVFASHDIPNSFKIADRLAILGGGKIVALGTRKELLASSDPFVREFLTSL